MQRIYLNNNGLTHLPAHIFDSFEMETLEAADITENRWYCVCGKEWLVDWLDELGDRDVGEGALGCLARHECGLDATKKREEAEAEARRSSWISIGATLLAVASIAILLIIAFLFITEGKHAVIEQSKAIQHPISDHLPPSQEGCFRHAQADHGHRSPSH